MRFEVLFFIKKSPNPYSFFRFSFSYLNSKIGVEAIFMLYRQSSGTRIPAFWRAPVPHRSSLIFFDRGTTIVWSVWFNPLGFNYITVYAAP
jgi:hypothetical protein